MKWAAPVFSSAWAMPSAAAMTRISCQSTLLRASVAEQQRVISISPPASIAATSMLSQPAVTTTTIPSRISVAIQAFSCRRGVESSTRLTRKKSRLSRSC